MGLATGDWELIGGGLGDRLHQPYRARLFPRSAQLLTGRRMGALGATVSGAGPTVLFWSLFEQTGRVIERLTAATDGWATVLRARFEPQGADVREL